MSSATTRGGARRGAGRKPKSLLELAERGTFSVTRHGRLLWTDDSLLEAAAERPDDEWLQRLAMIQRLARERGRGRHDVSWFARVIRERVEEQEEAKVAKLAKPHKIETTEELDADGALRIVACAEGESTPAITIRIVRDQLCPHCVGTVLRGVIERYEARAPG